MQLTRPTIPALRDRCAAGSDLLIAAPFYSAEGLSWVKPAPGGHVEFWTRLDPYEWATGVSDPPALLRYLKSVGSEDATVRIHRRLHAKIYRVDSDWAWIGSPNLSRAAFHTNVELVAELSEAEVAKLDELAASLRDLLKPVTLDDLEAMIDVASDAVREFDDGGKSEDLDAAAKLVDEILSPEPTLAHPERIPDLDDFIRYLDTLRGSIVEEIVAQHGGKQSRSGHVKQCYYGVALFLSAPEGAAFAAGLRELSLDEFPELPPDLVAAWVEFLDSNASHEDADRDYSFRTLRGELPPSLGGRRMGGGGASGTLKRMLPLVARFLSD